MNSELTVRSNVSKTCRGASVIFKNGYQTRINIVNDENGVWFTNSHSNFLGGGTIFLSSSMYVHGVSNVRQTEMTEIHTV